MSENAIHDPVFGALCKCGSGWRREVDQVLYGTWYRAELIVESNNLVGDIFPEQRQSYAHFKANEPEIMGIVETSLDAYIDGLVQEHEGQSEAPSRCVRLTAVVLPMVLSEGECSIGFLLECDCDRENGIGIKITNGNIEIGYQDILT